MALSELYISPGRVGRGGGGGHAGEEAHHELGASDIRLEREKKKPSSVNGISKYLLLCSRPVPPGGYLEEGKKEGKRK